MEESMLIGVGGDTIDDGTDKEDGLGTRENIGRWSSAEHDLFLQGLSKYGKDWKAIAGDIPTRNVVQVRTHAQKYFQKISANNASRTLVAISRRKVKDYTVKQRYTEEVEKPESTETSGSASPSSTENSGSPGLSTEKMETVIVAASVKAEEKTCTPLCQGLTPRSPRLPDNVNYDNEMYCSSYSQRGPYRSDSPFEAECNNNRDDMLFVDSDEDVEIDRLIDN